MQLPFLNVNSPYHHYQLHQHYNIGEMIDIHDTLLNYNLLADAMTLDEKGSDEDIVAYETWRSNLYSEVMNALVGGRGNLSDAVYMKLSMLMTLSCYPSTLESGYCVHVWHRNFMFGVIDARQYAGLMGGHLTSLTFTRCYDEYLARLCHIDGVSHLVTFPPLDVLMSPPK